MVSVNRLSVAGINVNRLSFSSVDFNRLGVRSVGLPSVNSVRLPSCDFGSLKL